MQRIKDQHPTNPFYDQTNRPETTSGIGNSLLFCACCWPSRRARDNSESNNLRKPLANTAPLKQQNSNSLRVRRSPSIYLSLTDLNRLPSPIRGNRLERLSARLSDAGSINDQPYLTARTSRSVDERRYKSMPMLVHEIRTEFLGNHLEEMKQEFYTFFRGGAEKPLLTSTNNNLPSSSTNIPPFPSTEPKIPDEVKVLDLSSLNEECDKFGKIYKLESTRSIPQTSKSAYELSLIPVRPFVGFLQRSIVRLPDQTYKSIIFMYWCMAVGFQKMFAYPTSNNRAIVRSSSQVIARHV